MRIIKTSIDTFFCRIVCLFLFGMYTNIHSQEIKLSKQEKEWIIQNRKNIKLGIHEYPPLIVITKTKPLIVNGISMEYIRIIEKKLGINFKILVFDSWSDLLQKAKNKEVDVVFAIQKTAERSKYFNFTSPYIKLQNMIVVKKAIKTPNYLRYFKNKKVAVVQNSAVFDYIKTKYPKIELLAVKDELNALVKVSTGEVNASVGEISRISYYISQELFSNLTVSGSVDFQYEFRFGVNKDLPYLQSSMEESLKTISSGTHNSILEKWIKIKSESFFHKKEFWFTISFCIFSVLIVSILRWNRTLNSLVEERTTELQTALNKADSANRMKSKLLKVVEESLDKAESANKLKSEFISNISHEIRTPMNAIIGFSEILQSQLGKDDLRYYTKSIIASGNILLKLLNDILDLSKLESGKIELENDPINSELIFEEMKFLFSNSLIEKNLQLIIDIYPHVPKTILIDSNKLRQILLNFIGNSIKFTEEGYIKIIVSGELSENEENRFDFVIKIIDTGIGIPKNEQENIFESFRQVDANDTKKYSGIGLGLTISKKLVHLMNGKLSLHSEVGKGTTFTIVFQGVEIFTETTKTRTNETKNDNMEKALLSTTNIQIDNTNDEDTSIENYTPEQIENLKKLQKIINEEKIETWKSIQEIMMIDDIMDFSNDMKELGKRFDYTKLIAWAEILEKNTLSCDTVKIKSTLEQFSDVLDPLNNL